MLRKWLQRGSGGKLLELDRTPLSSPLLPSYRQETRTVAVCESLLNDIPGRCTTCRKTRADKVRKRPRLIRQVAQDHRASLVPHRAVLLGTPVLHPCTPRRRIPRRRIYVYERQVAVKVVNSTVCVLPTSPSRTVHQHLHQHSTSFRLLPLLPSLHH
jgi:hypothetical protein